MSADIVSYRTRARPASRTPCFIAVDITPRPIPTTPKGRRVWARIGEQLHEGLTQQTWLPHSLIELLDSVFRERPESARPLPGVYSILNQSISILLQEMLRQKLTLHPPDVLIRPDLSISFLSYLQAAEGIRAGEEAAEKALPEIRLLQAKASEDAPGTRELPEASCSDIMTLRGDA